MKLYTIKNWDKLYENSRSRVVENLSWVPVPNKHDGENFSSIMLHRDGAKIFSGWILILQIASKCKERGILMRDNGQPHTPETMAIKSRAPREWFELALAYLCENTDWMEVLEVACQPPVICPLPARHPSAEEGNRIEGKEQNGREGSARDTLPDSASVKECLDYLTLNHDGFSRCPPHALTSILKTYDADASIRAQTCRTFILHFAGHAMPDKGTLWAKLDGYLRKAFETVTPRKSDYEGMPT